MGSTLDQQRAVFAWEVAIQGVGMYRKEYVTLAKGGPALIMNSGLMPTLAFYHSKGDAHETLCNHLAAGLNLRFKRHPEYQPNPTRFGDVMAKLRGSSSAFYMEATDEALEILKWIRQFVGAVPQTGSDRG